MSPDSFFSEVLETVREQNKQIASLVEITARQEEILKTSVLQNGDVKKLVTDIKADLDAHKKDAVTWSKLGKGASLVGAACGVILGVMGVLSKFNII